MLTAKKPIRLMSQQEREEFNRDTDREVNKVIAKKLNISVEELEKRFETVDLLSSIHDS